MDVCMDSSRGRACGFDVHRVTFELARMYTGRTEKASVIGFAGDTLGCPNCRAGSIEHAQCSVAGQRHQATAFVLHRQTHQALVVCTHLSIGGISDTFKQLG